MTTATDSGRVWDLAPDTADEHQRAIPPVALVERRGQRRWWAIAAAAALGVGALAFDSPAATTTVEGSSLGLEATVAAQDLAPGSMYHVVDQIGVRDLWAQGITGAGVNVAVIDTGIADIDALSGDDKIIAVADLSSEADDPSTRFVDTYGHGTAMAGIIGGAEPGANPATAVDHPEKYLGVAPDAGIVSVKISGRDGSSDPVDVAAGIDWVVAHADELDIRVINLSYGTSAPESSIVDPVSAAANRAWDAGIAVVTIAGNEGDAADRLAAPGIEPQLITVAGAEADASGLSIAEFSNRSDGVRRPDVAAPGAHIESLRAPGSDADLNYSDLGTVEGDPLVFRGTGTSQSAAVTSGVLALLFQQHPDMTNDQAKTLLTSTAQPIAGSETDAGAPLIRADLAGAAPLPEPSASADTTTGQDSGVDISNVTACTAASCWGGTSWGGTSWGGTSWGGTSWGGTSWGGTSWGGTSWGGTSWGGTSWGGTSWGGTSWGGTSWGGTSWGGTSWG